MGKAERQMGIEVAAMIAAAKRYCEAYEASLPSKVGGDYILGEEGIKPILQGLRTLLNGDIGQEDGGTLDRRILDIAAKHDLLDKNGEI